MASRHVSTVISDSQGKGLADETRRGVLPWEDDPTVSIPKWLMVLAARGEVTLRVVVDLEDDPLGELDDTIPGD